MIEMHQEGEPLGDGDDDYPPYQGSRTGWASLAFSAPAMALASLLLSFATLTVMQTASEVGDLVYFNNGTPGGTLSQLRVSVGVRLGVGLVGLLLAVLAAVQIHDDEDLGAEDADLALPGDPLWVRGVTGAALLISVGSVVLSAGALIYSLSVHNHLGGGF
jgi:hypothetical protein